MLTAAITAAITWVLGMLGIEPTLSLIFGIGVAVKVVIVGVIALIGWRTLKKREGRPDASSESEPPVDG